MGATLGPTHPNTLTAIGNLEALLEVIGDVQAPKPPAPAFVGHIDSAAPRERGVDGTAFTGPAPGPVPRLGSPLERLQQLQQLQPQQQQQNQQPDDSGERENVPMWR